MPRPKPAAAAVVPRPKPAAGKLKAPTEPVGPSHLEVPTDAGVDQPVAGGRDEVQQDDGGLLLARGFSFCPRELKLPNWFESTRL